MNFKLGDRVIAIKAYMNKKEIIGQQGTVIYIGGMSLTVEFDDDIYGHDGGGIGKYGHCWYFPTTAQKCLRPVLVAVEDLAYIVNTTYVYPNFKQWIKENAPTYLPFWKENCMPNIYEKYKVLVKAPAGKFPPFNQKTLCLIGNEVSNAEFPEPSYVFVVAEEGIYKADL
ncbi:MAG: hypothetical protein ACI37Z_05015 [Candidatus Gastranaerophilaceae bacterium]